MTFIARLAILAGLAGALQFVGPTMAQTRDPNASSSSSADARAREKAREREAEDAQRRRNQQNSGSGSGSGSSRGSDISIIFDPVHGKGM